MRSITIGCAIFFTAGLFFFSCSDSQSTCDSTASSGGPVDCHNLFLVGGECDDCLRLYCCAELADCTTKAPNCPYCTTHCAGCDECMTDPQRPITVALLNCAWDNCHDSGKCGGPIKPPPPPDGGVDGSVDSGSGGSGGSGGASSSSSSGP